MKQAPPSPKTVTRPQSCRPLPAVFAFILIFSAPAVVQAQFDYVLTDGGVTITRYRGPGGNVIVPDSIEGVPVTTIGRGAFWSCYSVTGVVIPDTVASIEESAFEYCLGLTNATIGSGVTNIGPFAFCSCQHLPNITIPDSVLTIEDCAFKECLSLTNAIIGKGVITGE